MTEPTRDQFNAHAAAVQLVEDLKANPDMHRVTKKTLIRKRAAEFEVSIAQLVAALERCLRAELRARG